jgi:IMP-specific 5'-nucleotidase
VHASAENIRIITFDADGTLYADGAHMEHDNRMIMHIIGALCGWIPPPLRDENTHFLLMHLPVHGLLVAEVLCRLGVVGSTYRSVHGDRLTSGCLVGFRLADLLRNNVHVAIVTAAGYPGQAERFEERFAGLLAAFRQLRLPAVVTDRSVARARASQGANPALVTRARSSWRTQGHPLGRTLRTGQLNLGSTRDKQVGSRKGARQGLLIAVTNGIQLVLSDMQNRTFGPHMAASLIGSSFRS